MIVREEKGIRWLQFERLSQFPQLKHAVFMRGEEDFSLSGTPSADENKEKVKSLFQLDQLCLSHQVHAKDYAFVGKDWQQYRICDALITNDQQLSLMIKHADCQATLLYDPDHHAVANVHCGWRGNVQNIYASVIEAMKKKYSTNPKHLIACIGPSLGPESAEFINYRTELPKHFWRFQIKPNYFDLWEISKAQLNERGLNSDNIEVAGIDTFQSKDCFSYRKKDTGRHGTIVCLL